MIGLEGLTQQLAAPGTQAAASTQKGGSSVDLSSAAQTVRTLRNAVNDAPSLRADRISQLKAQVQSGSYHVDSTRIAQAVEPVLTAAESSEAAGQ